MAGIPFTLGHREFIFSLAQALFNVLAFDPILFTFFCMKLSMKLSLKLIDFKWEKVMVLQLLTLIWVSFLGIYIVVWLELC